MRSVVFVGGPYHGACGPIDDVLRVTFTDVLGEERSGVYVRHGSERARWREDPE